MEHVESHKSNYVWDYFKDIEALKRDRLKALHHCSSDMNVHPNRYVPATLPILPFEDEKFDINLSAHFLFMYGDRLDFEFHRSTLKELLRVTREEIRVFPLVGSDGKRYEYLDEITSFLVNEGCYIEEIEVPYEFQRNANSMIKITKNV